MYGTSVFRLARTSSVRYYKNDSTKKLLEFLADMPKVNTKRIEDAQQQRQTISKKGEKYSASTVYLQVLGSGARGVPNTLYLFTDQKRYLFNCGECTQRLAHEHKVKLSRLEHIFITSKTWKNIGGLPGLSLTLQDVGVPKIVLHGPHGLDELYNATKRFVIMKEMQVTMAPSKPAEDFEDGVMTVKYVHLTPQKSLLDDVPPKPCKRARVEGEVPSPVYDQFTHDETDYYTRGTTEPDSKKPKPRPPRSTVSCADHKEKKKTVKSLNDVHCSVAYICTLKKRLGTLDLAKCVEKGVPPGPLLGKLKSGIDVVLPDGTLVLSRDVKTPDDPGPVFIVLELPGIDYLNEAEFAAHFDNGTNPPANIPTVIVHLSPPDVFHHSRYQAFMAKFGRTTRHLLLNEQNSCLGSEAVHRTQHKLHLIDPEVFPLLKDPSIPAEWSANPPLPKTSSPVRLKGFEDLKNRIAIAQFQNIINAESLDTGATPPESASTPEMEVYLSRTLTMFHLRPKRQIDRSAEPKLRIQDYYQEAMDVDGFVGSLQKFHALVHNGRYAKSSNPNEYPKLVFLGTGSCIPSKTRNTSGIIVHVNDQTTILLDCGEGTFGQLVRFYGPRRVDELLRTLKAIYISHLHADHHIGLIGVLQARAAAFAAAPDSNTPVLLLAPGQIVTWLTMYDLQFEKISEEFTLIPNQSLMENAKDSKMTSAALAQIGLEAVRTCLVPHCPNAFGVAVTAAGHKITYSGDTLPTQSLVTIGENSTILIHEATMEDELADEARVKMHSTTSQAIEIGSRMNAKYTVLTHFSQRYARLPRLNAHILHDNDTVGIAFDNMQIALSDLPLLPHMYAPLQLLFAEHCVDMELKAASRQRRRVRSSSSSSSLASGTTWSYRSRGCRSKSRCSSVSSTRSPARRCSEPSRDDGKRQAKMGNGMKSTTVLRNVVTRASNGSRESKVPSDGTERLPVASSVTSYTPCSYRETNASRLRREALVTSNSNLANRKKSPSRDSRRHTASNSPTDSAYASPRPASPKERAPNTDSEDTRRPLSNTEISKHAQEFLRAVSNPSCGPVSCRAKSIMYDIMGRENRREDLKNRSSDTKTFTMANSNNGQGKPLLKHMSTKPTVTKDSTPTNNLTAVRSDVGKKRSPSNGVKFSNTPLPKQGSTASPSDSKACVVPVPLKRALNNTTVACTRKLNTNGGFIITKSFKPQLEDIQSSYLLLKQKQENMKTDDSKTRNNWSRSQGVLGELRNTETGTRKNTTDETLCKAQIKLKQHSTDGGKRADGSPPERSPSPTSTCNTRRVTSALPPLRTKTMECLYALRHMRKLVRRRRPRLPDSPPVEFSRGLRGETRCIPKKPDPLNEGIRRMMLRSAKIRFKTKQYWCRSKYEKIEGLNWITWTQ